MRTLTLKRNNIAAWSDTTPFVLPEDFAFEVVGATVKNGEYIVTATLNGVKWHEKIADTVVIPQSFLQAGELEIVVALYFKGQKIAEYVADPLTIVEECGEVSAMPAITALRAEIEAVSDKLDALDKMLEEQKNAIEGKITALTEELRETKKELSRRMKLIEGGYDPLKV